MAAVRSFGELAVQNGRHSITKDAKKYAEQLDLRLWLNFPNPVAVADGKEVEAKKVKQTIYKARQQETQSTVSEERWQGKLIKNRWDDEEVKLKSLWKNAPTHTIAGVQELFQQLLPTKVYYNRKTKYLTAKPNTSQQKQKSFGFAVGICFCPLFGCRNRVGS